MYLALVALVVAVNGWLLAGCLVPYLTGDERDYVLLLQPVTHLLAWWVGSMAALIALRAAGLRRFSPILLLCLPVLALAILATPLQPSVAPWLYVAIDLRWWLLLVVVALTVLGSDRVPPILDRVRAFDRSNLTATPSRIRWMLDLSLIALLAVSSLLASPPLRFQSVLVGDEPKYLRYLENWYRGRGIDVEDLGPIADLPAGSAPDVAANFRLLGAALARAGADLESDTRRAIGRPARPAPGPAKSLGGWFVEGKRGGTYQVHSPGISLLLFPGYFIDRALGRTHVWHPQFPTDLYVTSLTVLVLYLLWGRAVFRLLWTWTERARVSWVLTCVVFLSVPVSAFAYQYYPEVAAGLLVAVLMRYTVISRDGRRLAAAAYGVAAGFLPWLHLRFLPLTLGAAVAVALTRRRDRGAVAAFAAGLAAPLAALGVYDYHIAGSLMPWALYALTTDASLFSAARAWRDLPAFWLDRTWGLVAHAPVFLFAVPGLWASWRRSTPITIAVAVAILSIAVPAAGHGYTGAFTTPLRLVAAVVPLLAIPLADAALAYGDSPVFTTALAFASVLSVQTGFTYNVHLVKSEAYLQAASIGGWMFPLLMPDFDAVERISQPLTRLWILATAGLVLFPLLMARRLLPPLRRWPPAVLVAAAIVAFAGSASVVAAATGLRFRPVLMLKAGDARDRLIHVALTKHVGIQWSSKRGVIDITSYFPEPDDTTTVMTTQPAAPRAAEPVDIALQIRRPDNRPGWGTATVDFGDASPPVRVEVEDSASVRHVYLRPGSYELKADVQLWGLPLRSLRQSIRVD